nr:Gag-Pol polyprotein [Tanacetum cinerariifolium]
MKRCFLRCPGALRGPRIVFLHGCSAGLLYEVKFFIVFDESFSLGARGAYRLLRDWGLPSGELSSDINSFGSRVRVTSKIIGVYDAFGSRTPTDSTTTANTAPTPTISSSHAAHIPNTSQDVDELQQQQHVHQQDDQAQIQLEIVADNVLNDMCDGNTFVNLFATPSMNSAESSSQFDHPLEQVIGEASRRILTRNQLRSDGDMCMYALTVSTIEPKNVKDAMTDPAWIESMQEELL